MELLTTSEAADYLRIGERKLYELVAEGHIPCSKVAGKWLFPRHELDRGIIPAGRASPDMTQRSSSCRGKSHLPATLLHGM